MFEKAWQNAIFNDLFWSVECQNSAWYFARIIFGRARTWPFGLRARTGNHVRASDSLGQRSAGPGTRAFGRPTRLYYQYFFVLAYTYTKNWCQTNIILRWFFGDFSLYNYEFDHFWSFFNLCSPDYWSPKLAFFRHQYREILHGIDDSLTFLGTI